jgi:hypothetical protein
MVTLFSSARSLEIDCGIYVTNLPMMTEQAVISLF